MSKRINVEITDEAAKGLTQVQAELLQERGKATLGDAVVECITRAQRPRFRREDTPPEHSKQVPSTTEPDEDDIFGTQDKPADDAALKYAGAVAEDLRRLAKPDTPESTAAKAKAAADVMRQIPGLMRGSQLEK